MPNTELYRPNVGIVIFNKNGKIWIGKRSDTQYSSPWQMPQGGIDKNESPFDAAVREVYEETGIKSIKNISLIDNWLKYKLPIHISKNKWDGKYIGQMQKWFLFYFFGEDTEININIYKNAEFSEWKWQNIKYILENIPKFRKEVYEKVFNDFAEKIKNTLD